MHKEPDGVYHCFIIIIILKPSPNEKPRVIHYWKFTSSEWKINKDCIRSQKQTSDKRLNRMYCIWFNAVTQIQQRRGTWHGREQSHEQDHRDGPWKGSPGLQELACCSYPPRTWSYLQPTRIWHIFSSWFFFFWHYGKKQTLNKSRAKSKGWSKSGLILCSVTHLNPINDNCCEQESKNSNIDPWFKWCKQERFTLMAHGTKHI